MIMKKEDLENWKCYILGVLHGLTIALSIIVLLKTCATT